MKAALPSRALILAPMVALSHRALRQLILGFGGLDLAFTEMASAGGLIAHTSFDGCYLDAEPQPERVVYQFFTTRLEPLPRALEMVSTRGVFGADINFGCSAPHILRSGGGAAWMREPEKAAGLIRLARGAWSGSLSAKLRIGAEDDYDRLRSFCDGLVEAGLDFLTLHPRLEGQKFRRTGRWDYVARLASELPVPVVGNGDVRNYDGYARWMGEARPAGIMIGREAARRPWIFALIRGREADPAFEMEIDLREVALRFLCLVEEFLPPEYHESRAKRFLGYFTDNFSFAHHLRTGFQNAVDIPAMRLVLDKYLSEVPGDRLKVERN